MEDFIAIRIKNPNSNNRLKTYDGSLLEIDRICYFRNILLVLVYEGLYVPESQIAVFLNLRFFTTYETDIWIEWP